MIDYSLILSKNYVGKQWSLNGDSYDGLDWLDLSPKPTQAELDALWESTKAQVESDAQAIVNTKAAAFAKLSALGLTENEVKVLLGIA
jgi:hypothetical protein